MEKFDVVPYDYPIQFKELDHSDFEGYSFEDEVKTIIDVDELGYISNKLLECVELTKKDTTVINASVGQGKTTAIIDFIKFYYQENERGNKCKVIVVTPFKTLNKEYIDKIKTSSGLEDICFDYQKLEEPEITKDCYPIFGSKPIQLISVKSLMGDPGTVGLQQSTIKREYYKYLRDCCEANDEKIILIFDEIHESLDSFSANLLPNLFEWSTVVHKIIVASATFNEASKVAIKFLANLTDKNIKIIESKRTQQINRLSELNLCFYNGHTFNENDENLIGLVEQESVIASTINILCFSKNASKSIYGSRIGSILKEKFGSVKLCIGGKESYFDSESCNIGTKFKTGISIEKDNSSYFVILPLAIAYTSTESNTFGIFTDRINSLIQALARPRKNSRIFIIVPSPQSLIVTPGMNDSYVEKLSLNYLDFKDKNCQTKFLNLNRQDSILSGYYQNNRNNLKNSIAIVENLESNISTQFPLYDMFKLKDGERFLYNYDDSYGKNLSNYTYWAAWNNQFVNCQLTTIYKASTFKFHEGIIQNELNEYFGEAFYNESFFTLNSDKLCYHKIRNTLFSNNLFYQKQGESEYSKVSLNRNFNFERQIITFIQRKKKDFNFEFRKLIYPPDGNFYNSENGLKNSLNKIPIDYSFSKEEYLRIAIAHSMHIEESADFLNDCELQLTTAYKGLYSFKEILLKEYTISQTYLVKDSDFKFKQHHIFLLKANFETILNYDDVLKFYSLPKTNDYKSIYRLLRKLFFETSVTTKNKVKVLKIISLIELPDVSQFVNLIYDNSDPWLNQSGKSDIFN